MKYRLFGFLLLLASTGYSREIPWSPFEWISFSIGDKTFDRAAILIPVKLTGTTRALWMQLDTGSDATMVYEIPWKQLHLTVPQAAGDSSKILLSAAIGNQWFDSLWVRMAYGFGDSLTEKEERPVIGTIGQDWLIGRILLLDFPHKRFCLLSSVESIPKEFLARASFVDLHNRNNKLFITIEVADTASNYFFFDTGSSLFQIVTTPALWKKFTGLRGDEKNIARLKVPSWGKEAILLGAPTKGPLKIGSLTVRNPTVYFDSTALNDFTTWPFKVDGLVGNALFYDHHTILIDLIKNRFGVLRNK